MLFIVNSSGGGENCGFSTCFEMELTALKYLLII